MTIVGLNNLILLRSGMARPNLA